MEACKTSFYKSQIVPRIMAVNHHVGGLQAESDNARMLSAYYQAWCNLAEDVMIRASVSDASRKSRMANLVHAISVLDATETLTICQDAASLLIRDSVSSFDEFQARLIEDHPVPKSVLSELFSPISPFLTALFKCPDVKAESLPSVLSFLRFGKKLHFKSIGLEEKAIAGYIETEERLATVQIDPNSDLVKGMNRLMRAWLKDLSYDNLIPAHGSGSVAQGPLTLYEKYEALGVDAMLRLVLGPTWAEYFPKGTKGTLDRTSRTIFVPKTFSKLRTISMEPSVLQYFQQGVMRKLYKYIDRHPYLGRRIRLGDQTQNQRFALRGSIDGSLATIDLSAASDSVSWSLVKNVFRGTPILRWLFATRSRRTMLPNGQLLDLVKFAPMGSALCFPVQCLIFAALIEYVSQKWCKQYSLPKEDYTVYGDDMVVATNVAEDVINALRSIGFIVNDEKSFTSGPFRESCGKDYYDGIDVSSVYYRLPAYQVKQLSPNVYAALCSCANMAYAQDFPNLRAYYISELLQSNCKNVYFTNTHTESPSLYSPQPTNYHIDSRWHEDYQRWSGKFCSVSSRPKRKEDTQSDQEIAYFDALLSLARRSDSDYEYQGYGYEKLTFSDELSSGATLHGVQTRLGSVEREVDV